jgi:hypothetical protein
MAMGPSGARCKVCACRLIAGSKLLLLLLLRLVQQLRVPGCEWSMSLVNCED